MTRNLFISAIFGGIVAGLLASVLQFTLVIPTLLEGEFYETGARVHFSTDGSPQSDRNAPALGGDWARHSMTVAFNIVTYTGYGLLLAAMISFTALKGIKTNALPKLMTTGSVELGFRFPSEIVEPSLKIFNLGDRHGDDPKTNQS